MSDDFTAAIFRLDSYRISYAGGREFEFQPTKSYTALQTVWYRFIIFVSSRVALTWSWAVGIANSLHAWRNTAIVTKGLVATVANVDSVQAPASARRFQL